MRIEQLFVAATPDGQFLAWYERTTHTGYHLDFTVTPDIEKASLSRVPGLMVARHARDRAPPHTWVPVERRVEVILKGYGV